MAHQDSTRRSHRIRTRFETHFSSKRQEGEGVLADISYNGALVENTGIQPHIDAHAILYISLPDDPKPFQVEGRITRHSLDGFAIEYSEPDATVREGVDRVARIVGGEWEVETAQAKADSAVAEAPVQVQEEAEPCTTEVPVQEEAELSMTEAPAQDEEDLAVTRPRLDEPQISEEIDLQFSGEIDLTERSTTELEALADQIAAELETRREEAKQRARDEAKKRVRDELAQVAEREGFSLEEVLDDDDESDA